MDRVFQTHQKATIQNRKGNKKGSRSVSSKGRHKYGENSHKVFVQSA